MTTNKAPTLCVDAILKFADTDMYVLVRRQSFPFGLALPGGKVEVGEMNYEAIIREVFEETGLVMEQTRPYWLDAPVLIDDPRGAASSHVAFGTGCGLLKGETGKTEPVLMTIDQIIDAKDEFALPDHYKILERTILAERIKQLAKRPGTVGELNLCNVPIGEEGHVETINRDSARIIASAIGSRRQAIGIISDCVAGERACIWNNDGSVVTKNDFDTLVPVKKTIKVDGWVYVLPNGFAAFHRVDRAPLFERGVAFARITVSATVAEGDGLDSEVSK